MIRGVNLGGWLVLEKWITPELFLHTCAEDVHDLYQELSKSEIAERLKEHFNSFITEIDFKNIADMQCDIVRLPIPYTVFGTIEGREGCLSYVDDAFAWAEKYDLKILLDLHTVPGGQNGMDNGGICGLCTWHLTPDYVSQTIELLIALAKRYASSKALFGIEPVNEPIDEKTFRGITYALQGRYHENIQKSQPVPMEFLKHFYQNVHQALTPILKPHQKLVFHDGFRLSEWNDFMPKEEYPNVWFDTHMYLNFAKYELKEKTSRNYIAYIYDRFLPLVCEAQQHHPLLIGEWTIAHTIEDGDSMNEEMLDDYYRASAHIQMMAFGKAEGWIYFNYRVNDIERWSWDFVKVKNKKLL